jgi:hypothetical protein
MSEATAKNTASGKVKIKPTLEIFVYDVLLVLLNGGFAALIYFQGSAMIAGSANAGITLVSASKLFMCMIFWAGGNLGLLLGLVRAMRRSGEAG